MPREPRRAYLKVVTLLVLVGVLGMIVARVATAGLYRSAWLFPASASITEQCENGDAVAASAVTTGPGRDGTVALFLEYAPVTDRCLWIHIARLSLPPPGFGVVSGAVG